MFRKPRILTRKNKPTVDYGRLQSAPAPQAPDRHSAHDPDGRPAPTLHGLTGHVCADADDGFKHLQAHVATTAFDSNDNVGQPKCHPNTRKAVQDDIMSCIENKVKQIMWLNGAAGSGKSAIGRSIVERCLSLGIPIARFFFFRTDPTRNGLNPVVATLVHELMQCIPELWSIIIPKIQTDSLIFTKSLETQFETLIFGPLLQLQRDSLLQQKTIVILLDGVDECIGNSEQAKLIQTVTNFVRKQCFPLIAFFGSRAENQLCAEFRSPTLSDILLQLPLDTDYRADEDILLFLNDSFAKIKSTHPFGSELSSRNWPAQGDVEEVMRKGSGQFIYASVVINFISNVNQVPAQQLEIVLGLRPSGIFTPFAQLDALYRHIFSQVVDIQAASLVLAYEIFTRHIYLEDPRSSSPTPIAYRTMTMTHHEISVALAALTPVLTYDPLKKSVKFLHASLPDFLVDRDRSQAYYIDRATWSTKLSILVIRNLIHGVPNKLAESIALVNADQVYFTTMVDSYLAHATPTQELKELVSRLVHIMKMKPVSLYNDAYFAIIQQWVRSVGLLYYILSMTYQYTQDFGDGVGGRVYRAQRKAMGHHMLAVRYQHVPKLLLLLLPNPVNIEKYRRDPTLLHEFCCSRTARLWRT